LMEHLYGRDGIAYEDYEYQLPKKKLRRETQIKYYDLIRPTRCVIKESQRYLRLEHEDKESYVSYFTVNAIVGELDFPSSEIFYFQQQQFTFPVDTSMNVEIVENRKALTTVRNKKKELKDLDNHAYQAGNETSSNVVDALDSVDELETDLDQTKESMYKLSYVIRVSAPDLDELKRRCDEVKDFYDDLNVKLVRPAGDMLGLHSEFLPASKRYINDYVQYVKSDFLAGLGFGATQQLGETTGIYMGYSVDTGRNVYLQPSLASQGVKGTVTNALASAFVGSLGGGKSFCNNLLVYYSVLFGGQAVILDPKSERGNWKETLPEIAHEINIVNLTSDKDNAGLLDPFVIMKNVKDAESLAIDILTFLTGISSRDGEKFPVLR
ncbi:ATP-binding protein, partial [Dorea longicatena]|uniref:ATP-binding protein n=1 Tax=Dorea longicatena TaxID=88431 RepID=UPI001EDE712D